MAVPGWPKSPANWSDDDGFKMTMSVGTAVAVDEDGNLIVAGNFLVDNKPQGYVALLNSSGSLLWEKAGQVGDEVTSVAAGTAQFSNRVFVGGSQRTSDNPVRTDGAVWVYHRRRRVSLHPAADHAPGAVHARRVRSRPADNLNSQRMGPRPRDPAGHGQRPCSRRAGVQAQRHGSLHRAFTARSSTRSAAWWARPGPLRPMPRSSTTRRVRSRPAGTGS
jgi:hypothetical protein